MGVIFYNMDRRVWPQGRYPESFLSISSLEVCQEWGGSFLGILGGRWGLLTGDLKDRVILDIMDDLFWPQKRYLENFMMISVLEVCQEWGGQEWGYLEDVEGFWPETWRTGSSLMSWMIMFYPKEDTLKVLCWYLYWKYVKNGGTWRTLRVLDRPLGGDGHPWCHGWSYFGPRKIALKFRVDIFIRSVSGRGGVKKGGT